MICSYSFLRDYENCPRKCHHLYVLKDLPKEDTPQLRRGNHVHKALAKRINDKVSLPDDCVDYERFVWMLENTGRPLQAELGLGITDVGSACGFFDDNVWCRGRCDVVVSVSDTVALITDWKTGKRREDPHELEVQAVLLKAHYPKLKSILGNYVWLLDGVAGATHGPFDTERTLAEMRSTMNTAENRNAVGHWPPQQNPLCGWCPVKTCEYNRS